MKKIVKIWLLTLPIGLTAILSAAITHPECRSNNFGDSKLINFQKWHAIGNDFVIIDNRKLSTGRISEKNVKMLCHRHFGIGCDQLIIINPSKEADCEIIIYNPDGSKANACGNSTRCITKILNKPQSKIKVGDRILSSYLIDRNLVRVNMGQASFGDTMFFPETPFQEAGYAVEVGNPHLVLFVSDLDKSNTKRWGPYFENHPNFPKRTNVEFVQILSNSLLMAEVWERGTGEMLASGSGACAIVAIGHKLGLLSNTVQVLLKGGSLNIEITNDGIYITGDAVKVFEGSILIPTENG